MQSIINNLNSRSAYLMNELDRCKSWDRFPIIFKLDKVEAMMHFLIDAGVVIIADDVDTALQIEMA
jgi:hypothetical protein